MLSNEQISKLKLNEQKEILSKRIERYQYLGLLDNINFINLQLLTLLNTVNLIHINIFCLNVFYMVLMFINLKKLLNYTGIRKDALQKFGNVGKEKSMLGNKRFVIKELMLILGKHFLIAH